MRMPLVSSMGVFGIRKSTSSFVGVFAGDGMSSVLARSQLFVSQLSSGCIGRVLLLYSWLQCAGGYSSGSSSEPICAIDNGWEALTCVHEHDTQTHAKNPSGCGSGNKGCAAVREVAKVFQMRTCSASACSLFAPRWSCLSHTGQVEQLELYTVYSQGVQDAAPLHLAFVAGCCGLPPRDHPYPHQVHAQPPHAELQHGRSNMPIQSLAMWNAKVSCQVHG